VSRPNLVVLHLESLSMSTLRGVQSLPALERYMSEGISFGRFMSSATSSLMAVSDFMFGNGGELDHIADFDGQDNRPAARHPHLFQALRRAGYSTCGVGCPPIWRDDVNGWELWGADDERFEWVDTHEAMLARVEQAVRTKGGPFALYVWDQRSHLSYSDDSKGPEMKGFERIVRGRQSLDETVAAVRAVLERNGCDDNTLVVGFGDHGDQFWTNGSYFGFAHGYEPYSDLVWTPAFVWGRELEGASIDQVTSLVDLAPMIRVLLGLPAADTEATNAGHDALGKGRDHAFSQNLFTNQRPNKALPKAFSVTDAAYHLVWSESGLELFRYDLDPSNHTNLLHYFELSDSGELRPHFGESTHSHFLRTFNATQVAEIVDRFYRLRFELVRLLREKSRACAENPIDPRSLFEVRPHGRTWNLDHRGLARDDSTAEMLAFQAGSGRYRCLFEPSFEAKAT
jgi:arylsulfatase A-like enzyme